MCHAGLQVGQVDLWFRLGVRLVANITHHPHDGHPFLLMLNYPTHDRLAETILAVGIAANKGLIYDSDARQTFTIVIGEVASPHERNSHGAEIIRADHLERGSS